MKEAVRQVAYRPHKRVQHVTLQPNAIPGVPTTNRLRCRAHAYNIPSITPPAQQKSHHHVHEAHSDVLNDKEENIKKTSSLLCRETA